MIAFLILIAKSLYFALPMYAANMAPVIVSRLPLFDVRLDFGREWRGKPLLGAHKTWRGLIAGVIAGVIIAYIQSWFSLNYEQMRGFGLIDYRSAQPLVLGVLMGLGAILGDAIKSFFKRRASVAPGQPWVPFDQVDFVLGGLILSSFYVWPGLIPGCIILLFTPVLHVLTNAAAYKLGIKSVPW